MVPIHNTLKTTVRATMTTRIVPKTIKTTAAGPSDAPATTASTPGSTSDAAADFKALFGKGSYTTLPTTPAVTPKANPTLQSVFGSNPYVSNPGGVAPNGVTYDYNPVYFATRATADKLAQMYGGTVIETNAITPYGPFVQNQANEMIRFSNGNVVNAGILASYYDRGWTQSQVDAAIQNEINSIPT